MRLLLSAYMLLSMANHATEVSDKRVLLINSYHQEYPWTKDITTGVEQVISQALPAENLLIEYMDGRRFDIDPTYAALLHQVFKYKYSIIQPDIVLVSDDSAYQFSLLHGDDLFPNKPIIFSGVNNFLTQHIQDKPQITGIIEGIEIAKNIQLIQQVQPELQKLVLVADQTELGQSLRQNAEQALARLEQEGKLKPQLQVEIWQDFSLAELTEDLAKLTAKDAVFIIIIRSDKNGRYFDYQVELPHLSEVSQAPLYGMWGAVMVGNGVVGGYVNDPLAVGQGIAQIALDALRAPNAPLPEVRLGAFSPIFDHAQLQNHSIPESLLPKNTVIINQPQSFYRKHQLVINSSALIVIILMLIISILMANIRKRMRAERDLKQLNAELDGRIKERTKVLYRQNRDLTRASRKMQKMAYTDPLTKLGNRRAATEDFTKVQKHLSPEEGLVIALLDLDHFKRFNDQFGHDVGDQILIQAGATWNDSLRPSDEIYRWGGEEFLLLMPNTNTSNGMMVCERLRNKISQLEHQQTAISCSIGLAQLERCDDMDSLVKRADIALYQAKQDGRNCVRVADANQG